MKYIPCPACNASGAICSTCDSKRLVRADARDWREMTETQKDWERVDRDMRRALRGRNADH